MDIGLNETHKNGVEEMREGTEGGVRPASDGQGGAHLNQVPMAKVRQRVIG